MAHNGLMVSVSGIRGRVGEALTPEIVASYAAAFGAWALKANPGKPIVVGRDSRVSGPMFHRVTVGVLQSVGANVIDIGLTTTPTCQPAVEDHHAAGGIMISASHTPIEWNALKFIGPSGLFLEAGEGAQTGPARACGGPRRDECARGARGPRGRSCGASEAGGAAGTCNLVGRLADASEPAARARWPCRVRARSAGLLRDRSRPDASEEAVMKVIIHQPACCETLRSTPAIASVTRSEDPP